MNQISPQKLGITLAVVLALGASSARADFEISSVHLADGGATVVLEFTSLTGMSHRVEMAPSLESGTWTDAGVAVEGDGNVKLFAIPTAGQGGRHYFRVTAATTVPTGFVLIPGGTFQMGDTFNEGYPGERPVHGVNVSAFYMATHETTKAQWDEVRAWGLNNGYTDLPTGTESNPSKGANHPVHSVSWYDVVKWCNARSEKEGLEPCYHTDVARTVVYKTGQADVTNSMVDWSANGYRLPTEAEWEMAARGGLAGKRFPWGDTISHAQANYYATGTGFGNLSGESAYHPSYQAGGEPYTSPVGSFAPNAYGLYDMTGNVWEWCWDWRGDAYYATSPPANPQGPETGSFRVFRGGSWDNVAVHGRVAVRFADLPSGRLYALGFRPARGQ